MSRSMPSWSKYPRSFPRYSGACSLYVYQLRSRTTFSLPCPNAGAAKKAQATIANAIKRRSISSSGSFDLELCRCVKLGAMRRMPWDHQLFDKIDRGEQQHADE